MLYYYIETKCRICGTQHVWKHGDANKTKWDAFLADVSNATVSPKQYPCEECAYQTVQDVVAFTNDVVGVWYPPISMTFKPPEPKQVPWAMYAWRIIITAVLLGIIIWMWSP